MKSVSFWLGAIVVLGATTTSGCAAFTQITSSPSDYHDYRAYRVAAHEGRRLELADRYLQRHPDGKWIGEVTEDFRTSELVYFREARTSREGVRNYLSFLPRGPHALEAQSFLESYDGQNPRSRDEQWLTEARATESMLSQWAEERRGVNEAVFAALSIMLAPEMDHATLDSVGPLFTRVYGKGRTWGVGHGVHKELRFRVPTGRGYALRRMSFDLEAEAENGRVTSIVMRGPALFLRWCESSKLVALDPQKVEDRLEANLFALETLGAAAEARFPKRECAREPGQDNVVVVRACREKTFVGRALADGTDEVRVFFRDVTRP